MDEEGNSPNRRPSLSVRIKLITASMKPEKAKISRQFRYTKAFLLDHWQDIVAVLFVSAVAGAVCVHFCRVSPRV